MSLLLNNWLKKYLNNNYLLKIEQLINVNTLIKIYLLLIIQIIIYFFICYLIINC